MSGFLYTDEVNKQEYPTTKLMLALANHKDLETPLDTASKALVLIYQNSGYVKPLNHLNIFDFFMAAFLTFSCFQVGGHLTKRDESWQIQVLLQS